MSKGWYLAVAIAGLLVMMVCFQGFASLVVDFTFQPQTPIVKQVITFTEAITGDEPGFIVRYEWDFDDGNTAVGEPVQHAFMIEGQYRVTLTVLDDRGVKTEITRTVQVGVPEARFSWFPLEPTTLHPVRFTGQAIPAEEIHAWSWDFGDGRSSDTQKPTHTFTQVGTYRVVLMITYETGVTASVSHDIVVASAPPTAKFTFTPANPAIGKVVKFNAVGSNDPDGRIISYEWDFPDVVGNINATGVEVSHSFNAAGTHPVTLTVTDNAGNRTPSTEWVPVETTPPVAAFIFTPERPNTGQVITFDGRGSSDEDGTIILWEWDFNGDRTTDLTGSVVTHSFPTPGVYPVRLTVTDNDGAIDVITLVVPVEVGGVGDVNQLPVADFTFEPAEPPDVNINEVVTLKADGSSDADGTIDAYEWDFDNDGIYDATGKTAAHVFHTGGSKIVTLRVTDNDGGWGFKTRVVSVEFVRPIADFTSTPDEPLIGDVVTFDASISSDADGHVDFYEWDFDSDGIVDATGMSVNRAFAAGGSQPVTLKVTDDDGVTDYITKRVFVRINNPPLADFTYSPENPTTADTIAFNDTSTDPDGTIIAWQWEFGDGETSDAESPSHKYATVKTYSVKLTVTDNDGATSNVTKNITVSEPANVPPVANFSFTPTLPQVNQAVQFTDLSTDADGTITGWDWDFGDGGTSTGKNPTHQYTTVGIYTVALTVIDNNGAASTKLEKQITIGEAGADIVTYSYPNPSSTQTQIIYSCPVGATEPVLRIYNLTGALVYEKALTVGESPYAWDLTSDSGAEMPNGIYFCVVTAKNASGKTIKSAIFKLLIVR